MRGRVVIYILLEMVWVVQIPICILMKVILEFLDEFSSLKRIATLQHN